MNPFVKLKVDTSQKIGKYIKFLAQYKENKFIEAE